MKAYASAPELSPVLDPTSLDIRLPRDLFPGLASTDRAPREAIQHLAYQLWQKQGEPENRHLDHWLEAESQLMRRA